MPVSNIATAIHTSVFQEVNSVAITGGNPSPTQAISMKWNQTFANKPPNNPRNVFPLVSSRKYDILPCGAFTAATTISMRTSATCILMFHRRSLRRWMCCCDGSSASEVLPASSRPSPWNKERFPDQTAKQRKENLPTRIVTKVSLGLFSYAWCGVEP